VSTRVDPSLRREVVRFGGNDIDLCMNCGNCTAECPLSCGETVFPRKVIRYLQLGMRDRLRECLEPWLCYYCGECSKTCPREANPGETMMATRRWLTAEYDWTGLSRRLYVSKAWEVGLSLAVGLFVVALFALFHGPMVIDRVELNTFAPVKWVEYGDWIMAATLALLLFTNASRMHRFVMRGEEIPVSVYLSELKTLFVHGLTQRRWRECEGPKTRWLKHFLLFTAYSTMLILVVIFLRWFQTDGWNFTSLLGYYATAVLLYVTGDAMIGRIRKREEIHKRSHPTDWMFLILLLLTSLTGILVHLLRMGGLPLLTYYTYVIHLAVAVPMLVVEVPFGKWAHLLYRPLAMYLTAVKEKAREASTSLVGAREATM
jgi:ferredoxin